MCAFLILTYKFVSMVIVETVGFLNNSPRQNINNEIIYQDGRKTIQSFGSRKEFAILRGIRVDEQGNIQKESVRWSLYNRDTSKDIDYDITAYIHESPCVYTMGEKGYTKLNYETGEVKQSQDILEFSEGEREILKELQSGKGNKRP